MSSRPSRGNVRHGRRPGRDCQRKRGFPKRYENELNKLDAAVLRGAGSTSFHAFNVHRDVLPADGRTSPRDVAEIHVGRNTAGPCMYTRAYAQSTKSYFIVKRISLMSRLVETCQHLVLVGCDTRSTTYVHKTIKYL